MNKNLIKFIIVVGLFVIVYNNIQTNPAPIDPPKPIVNPTPVVIPIPKINLVEVKKHRSIEEKDTIYSDVINHVEKPYGDQGGRTLNVHESAHHIVSDIKNKYRSSFGNNIQGLYYGNGNGILLKHPNVTIKDVGVRIPSNLRSYRYQLYFVSQLKYWNNEPLYILNEWTAYVWGGSSALEDYNQNKIINVKTDAVSGCLDFSIYALYLVITIKDKDIEYWNTNEQFKLVIKHYLEVAEKTFFEGKDIFKNSSQSELFENFTKLQNSHELKQLLIQDFDSLFVRKINIQN